MNFKFCRDLWRVSVKAVRILLVAVMASVLTVLGVGSATAETAPPSAYPPPSCPLLSVSTTTPFPGQTITIAGENFTPTADVTIKLDTSATLAHVIVKADGSFSVPVKLAADLVGHHVISAVGVNLGKCPVEPIQINIQASGTSGGGLASTGVDILTGIAVALALIGAGVLLARGGRRRHSHH